MLCKVGSFDIAVVVAAAAVDIELLVSMVEKVARKERAIRQIVKATQELCEWVLGR